MDKPINASALVLGHLTSCPGYLSVTISAWTAPHAVPDSAWEVSQEELFKYDFLISCPETFYVSFYAPRSNFKNETFLITLDDAHYIYRSYISYLYRDTSTHTDRSPTAARDVIKIRHRKLFHPTMFFSFFGFLLTLSLLACVVVEVKKRQKKKKRKRLTDPKVRLQPKIALSYFSRPRVSCATVFSALTVYQRTILIAYIVMKLVTRSLLTFTVFYLLLCIYYQFQLRHLSRSSSGSGSGEAVNFFKLHSRDKQWLLEGGVVEVMKREQEQLSRDQAAIRLAYNKQWRDLTLSIDHRLLVAERNATINPDFFSPNATQTHTRHALEKFNAGAAIFARRSRLWAGAFRTKMAAHVCPVINRFVGSIGDVADNDWFLHPSLLYNRSIGVGEAGEGGRWRMERESGMMGEDREGCLCEVVCRKLATWKVKFVSFLGAAQAENVLLWNSKIVRRLVEC